VYAGANPDQNLSDRQNRSEDVRLAMSIWLKVWGVGRGGGCIVASVVISMEATFLEFLGSMSIGRHSMLYLGAENYYATLKSKRNRMGTPGT
jgi:hypothetical protein